MNNDLSKFTGCHFLYQYANGWCYEMYIKNEKTIDYRIHSGIVAGRWVKDQHALINRIADNVFKFSWDEPTGTFVSITINLEVYILHGTVAFPKWIIDHPEKTVCFQNDHLALMRSHRDKGPTYDKTLEDNFAKLYFFRNAGKNNESVIDCPIGDLPKDYPFNLKGKVLL
ncbi:phenolic acid decarboxylase [Flagellimonas allohymeniacidonis]|uniref:Phenolic acid decarboxylase n=1 Tax=Flagellimonas allohymeniacidonis TaxID=2517819 RepID=A0A4Q8QJR4_9FLAO|nr:phenolic acid decarboxylase [Allomuricauda hymeniacidonis]TAI49568.1 phenolic acid decarboxylase [Allomuricauda hymeniacidonis]